ncbi:MAG: peptide ABC transporter substrate-binding protein [Chloroflexi bacterium]|nr:peptide ABC transporter substrate-binding protein [Chloroflexota bacterium]MCI0835309.1 peptide ABC transporter substrate-binding protein [Chloroflexota bacterium]
MISTRKYLPLAAVVALLILANCTTEEIAATNPAPTATSTSIPAATATAEPTAQAERTATTEPTLTTAPAERTATIGPTLTTGPATPTQMPGSPVPQEPDASAATSEDSDPRRGGVFNTLWSDPPTLDPHVVTDGTSLEIVIEIFSGLVHLGPDTSNPFEPDLAESWSISGGSTVYVFKLRNDLKFSNGDPVTAQDFKWSFERAAHPDTASTIAGEILGDIVGIQDIIEGNATTASGIEVIDERTLRITIDAPKAYFIAKLTYPTAFVLNRENVESAGDSWTDDPVGTGPFVLKEYRVGQRIRIARNDNYWGRAAYLDEVVFNLAGGVAMAMYENDEIDVTGVGFNDLDRVQDPTQEISNDLVDVPADFGISYIGFNLAEAPFDDANFRRALNHAVDKQLIAEQVFLNQVKPASGIIPPGFPGYSPEISGLEFDLELAQDLLAQSAYADPETRPRIVITEPGTGGTPSLTTRIVAEMWLRNLGVEIEIQQVDWATYLDDLYRGRLQVWGGLSWQADYPDPQSFLDVLFRSDSSINHGGYSNIQVDEYLIAAQIEQDRVRRIGLYNDAEQLIVSDAAWLPLWWGVGSKALVKPWVEGYKFSSLSVGKYKDVWINR